MPLDQVDVDNLEDQEVGEGKEMTFLEHLEELRMHIIRSLVAIVLVGIVLFIFKDWFFEVIIFGPTHETFFSYTAICGLSETIGLGDRMCFLPPNFANRPSASGKPLSPVSRYPLSPG